MNNFINKFQKYKIPTLDLGVKLPKFEIEKRHLDRLNLDDKTDDYYFLLALCLEGLDKKIGRKNPRYKEYHSRMKEELEVLKQLGFCSYLLITWDIVNHCIENKIPTGYARGSSAGSLVLFLINVTQIDSLKNGLYFQRFLSKSRAKITEVEGIKYYDGSLLMDIDLDIAFSDRKRLTNWLEEKYNGKIAKLLTVSTFSTKILLKEVAKCHLQIDESTAGAIADMIPKVFGKVKSIEESSKLSKEFEKFCKDNVETIDIAKNLYESISHFGVHPSAWIITADALNDIFPLQLTKERELVTAYSMDDALNLSIKCDILGLRCCNLIDSTCKMVGINQNEIDLNDSIIYDNLQNLQTPHGLFQIEAFCNLGVVKKLKPKNLNHLAAVISCARPGGLEFVDDFAKFIETGEFKSIHPFFDEILKESAGVPIYQEHQLKMLNKIGFSLEESEVFRRILGKKKVDEVEDCKNKIRKKCKENNLQEDIAEIVCKVISDSASYSFNFSHAISYASMCAATCYLKFKYPQQFYLSLLNLTKDEPNPIEEVSKIQSEMDYFSVKLLQPDIILSDLDFRIEDKDIRMGIGNIKGVAQKTLEKLKSFRHEYSSKFDIFNAASESKLGIGVLSALIQSGCLSKYTEDIPRSKLVLEAQLYNLLTVKEKKRVMDIAQEFKYDLVEIVKFLSKAQNGSDKSFIKESRMDTIRSKFINYKKIYDLNSRNEQLACWWYESELLGFSYSSKLIDILKKEYADILPINEAIGELNDTKVQVGGRLFDIKRGTSKNKNKYIKGKIDDGSGNSINIMIMERNFAQNSELNSGRELEESDVIVANGTKKSDIIFCDRIVNQKVKIMTKLSELRNSEKEEKVVDKITK